MKGIAITFKTMSMIKDTPIKIYLVMLFFQLNPLNFKSNIGNLDTISSDPITAIDI